MNKILNNKYIHIIILVLVVIYPLRWTFTGLDLWDAGYNCVNYVNFSPDVMTPKLFFSMYLAGALGHAFTLLPFGGTYAGLRFYCGLIISANVLLSYVFFTKDLRMNKWAAVCGELLAVSLCYSPTVILYNHLSFLLLDLAVIFIYRGLTGDKDVFLASAGALLGINVFVRFSNLTQALLILAVWYYCFLKRNRISLVIRKTLICMAGYLISAGALYGILAAKYGKDAYINGIRALFAMTDEAEEYTPVSMVVRMFDTYLRGARRLVDITIFALLSFALIILIFKIKGEKKETGNRKIELTVTLTVSVMMCVYLIAMKLMQFDFHHYITVILTAAMFADLAIIVCIVNVLKKGKSIEERLTAALILLLAAVLSVGSNTSISPVMNDMFLIAPYMVCGIVTVMVKEYGLFVRTLKRTGMVALTAFFIQCLLFGLSYCYVEAGNGSGGRYTVTGSRILSGIRMDEERAGYIQGLSDHVKTLSDDRKGVIIYGYAPALAYYLDLKPVITSWPDLASYNYYEMKNDMDRLERSAASGTDVLPLVLIDKEGVEEQKELGPDKWKLLDDFMKAHAYGVDYENEKFVIYRSL